MVLKRQIAVRLEQLETAPLLGHVAIVVREEAPPVLDCPSSPTPAREIWAIIRIVGQTSRSLIRGRCRNRATISAAVCTVRDSKLAVVSATMQLEPSGG